MGIIAPLFIATVDEVKARLRLSGVSENTNAQAMIEEAVRVVRVGFYRKISNERITEIANFAVTVNPDTDEQIIRQLAEVTELKWIRLELLRTMPTLFADAIPASQEAWNTEGFLRGAGNNEREMEMRRLEKDIDQSMSILRQEEELANETTVHAEVYVSKTPPPPLRSSVFPVFPSLL